MSTFDFSPRQLLLIRSDASQSLQILSCRVKLGEGSSSHRSLDACYSKIIFEIDTHTSQRFSSRLLRIHSTRNCYVPRDPVACERPEGGESTTFSASSLKGGIRNDVSLFGLMGYTRDSRNLECVQVVRMKPPCLVNTNSTNKIWSRR